LPTPGRCSGLTCPARSDRIGARATVHPRCYQGRRVREWALCQLSTDAVG
jgi:hypothetical protein